MAQGAFQEGKLGMTIQHLARSPARLLRAVAEPSSAGAAALRCRQKDWFSNARMPGRADEISSASGMAELSLLTSEALAYVHALSGDFSKEARYRAQCAQASSALRANSPGPETDLTLFDCLHK